MPGVPTFPEPPVITSPNGIMEDQVTPNPGTGRLFVTTEVVNFKRCIKHIILSNYSANPLLEGLATALIGVTGSSFNPYGSPTGDSYVANITGSTAKISRIKWSLSSSQDPVPISLVFSESGDQFVDPPSGNLSKIGFTISGSDGDLDFDRFSIKNTATNPSGSLYLIYSNYDGVTPSPIVNGTIDIEFVL